jgi:hypothetical protein
MPAWCRPARWKTTLLRQDYDGGKQGSIFQIFFFTVANFIDNFVCLSCFFYIIKKQVPTGTSSQGRIAMGYLFFCCTCISVSSFCLLFIREKNCKLNLLCGEGRGLIEF